MPLQDDLRKLLTVSCRESMSNTPDFILAQYMMDSLSAFESAVSRRDSWAGISALPLCDTDKAPNAEIRGA